MCGQVFMASALTTLTAGTVYNPSLVLLVQELLQAPLLLLPLPQVWERKSYGDFAVWLLRSRNLIALGIYRSSSAADAGPYGRVDVTAPTHYYTYTAPPANTLLIRSDSILCTVPNQAIA
uniref:Uncharacterized protein n=1 Tax=Pyrodinium bahamense TaxID=73915 RepID=A0A7S0AFR1_9DINO|mmetsp:Transcript_33560/g.92937  ORF Transcript_33560/g.92937 Transcript_33560/m.92937 type:complete len:120 (+) Transcript_33560:2-361(+)